MLQDFVFLHCRNKYSSSSLNQLVEAKRKIQKKIKPLMKPQNNKIATCCRLGLIEPVHGLVSARYCPRPYIATAYICTSASVINY